MHPRCPHVYLCFTWTLRRALAILSTKSQTTVILFKELATPRYLWYSGCGDTFIRAFVSTLGLKVFPVTYLLVEDRLFSFYALRQNVPRLTKNDWSEIEYVIGQL